MEERRQAPRAPIELKVEYKRLNSFFADYTRNLSKGGTFIATSKPLPVGTEFLFRLIVPKLQEPLEIRGEVAWVVTAEEATPNRPAGMGIQFRYQNETERNTVQKVIEQLVYDSLGSHVGGKLLEQTRVDGARPDDSRRDDPR